MKGSGSRFFVEIKSPDGFVKAESHKDLLDYGECLQTGIFQDNGIIWYSIQHTSRTSVHQDRGRLGGKRQKIIDWAKICVVQ